MKVLVVDQSPLVRDVLKQALEAGGWTVECFDDALPVAGIVADFQTHSAVFISAELAGGAAFKMAERFATRPPERAVSTFIVTLRCEAKIVVDGLNSGAADVLVLPMPAEIIRAKMEAAERSMKRLEAVATGNVIAEVPVEATPSNVRATASTISKKLQSVKAFASTGGYVIEAISGLGLEDVAEVPQLIFAEKEPTFAMWCTVVSPGSSLWVDVLVESDRKSSMLLFQTLTGMPASSGKDALDTIGEVVNMVQGAVKSALQAEGHEVITPVVPRAVPTANLPKLNDHMVDRVRVAVDAGGISISITLFISNRVVTRKTIESLRPKDVTIEALSMPGMDLKLLNRGVMLDDRGINALREKLTGDARRLVLNVMEAPSLVDLLRAV